jgi:hypothetical protein
VNRFEKKSKQINQISHIILPLLFVILFFFLFIWGISSVDESTSQKQYDSLQTAIQRDMIQCYAIEGTYPPNLDYLKEHYGLTYDENLFFVDYQTYGANILPDVTIIMRRSESSKESTSL